MRQLSQDTELLSCSPVPRLPGVKTLSAPPRHGGQCFTDVPGKESAILTPWNPIFYILPFFLSLSITGMRNLC